MIRPYCAASVLALILVDAAAAQTPVDPHAGHDMPAAVGPAPAAPDMSTMDHSQMPGMDHGGMAGEMAGMDHSSGAMTGALGAYPMTRESSGTAWQPDASEHSGLHAVRGDWMLMGHATINGVHDWQEGPRGGERSFVSGMVMGMARRDFASGDALQLRAMLSPDPLMGRRGYPLLLASGETADGVRPLVDRQHPHDLFMELSASYSHRLGAKDSVFVYAGLPGEPAFGPGAFMHRMSIMDSPEAPISHHWLDSTHIVFGVVTAGYVHDDWKVEVSRFKGREPDERRYDIETPKFDSTAIRLSWNPTRNLALQTSWAKARSVEQLEPDADQTKWSASAIYTVPFGDAGWWSTTAAWGRRSAGHDDLDAWVLESAIKPNAAWTVFGRAERTENNELSSVGGHHGPVYKVAKASLGVIHDWRVAEQIKFGVGGLYAVNFVPRGLEGPYGGDPNGAIAFVRLKIG
ncbi:MAG: hypothetical protein JWO33_1259 [Caulobacteraceae bacterium]|nr:hypothetical protein [Caulobacteraceae bacterium]